MPTPWYRRHPPQAHRDHKTGQQLSEALDTLRTAEKAQETIDTLNAQIRAGIAAITAQAIPSRHDHNVDLAHGSSLNSTTRGV